MTDSYAERLASVNSQIQFTNIRGKNYAEVAQRTLAFWSLFPLGRIETEKIFDDSARCDFECRIYRDDSQEKPAAIAHAYELKTGKVNSTSYIENCETSAVGRALGLLGIGATSSIASADEVLAALEQQSTNVTSQQTNVTSHKAAPSQEHTSTQKINGVCQGCGVVYEFASREQMQQFRCPECNDNFIEVA